LLLAYAVLFPTRKVIPLIPPIPMPAWLFATLYAGIELFLGVTGTLAGVAHFAHLGGMVGSALVIMQWRRAGARKIR
jgi:membrane associated rhomboid family serine protease